MVLDCWRWSLILRHRYWLYTNDLQKNWKLNNVILKYDVYVSLGPGHHLSEKENERNYHLLNVNRKYPLTLTPLYGNQTFTWLLRVENLTFLYVSDRRHIRLWTSSSCIISYLSNIRCINNNVNGYVRFDYIDTIYMNWY